MKRKISKSANFNDPVPSIHPGYPESTFGSGIGGGINIQDKEVDDSEPVPPSESEDAEENTLSAEHKDVLNKLINLSDDFDLNDQEKSAEFCDFLIYKFSQAEDYSEKFRELIIQISESDVLKSKELAINIVTIYANKLKSSLESGVTKEQAKAAAYHEALKSAPSILSKQAFLKNAQMLQDNPKYVAKVIYNVIEVMINRISMQSRYKAKPNIKKRIEQINIYDVSKKRAPGGAAIGLSIGLVKNILNGQSPTFIQMVINELGKLL